MSDAYDITQLLDAARGGDRASMDRVLSTLYQELHTMARRQLAGQQGQTLNATALVHEAYLKLAGGAQLAALDRNHLLALSARAMRQVLVDDARARKADKRGGGQDALTLTASLGNAERAAVDVLALDELLGSLHTLDERAAQIVELRYFGGYEEAEIAQMLGLSDRTVRRDWRKARAFLLAELQA